jgi:hypothetical protein
VKRYGPDSKTAFAFHATGQNNLPVPRMGRFHFEKPVSFCDPPDPWRDRTQLYGDCRREHVSIGCSKRLLHLVSKAQLVTAPRLADDR